MGILDGKLQKDIDNLIQELQEKKHSTIKAIIGLDGFVDEIIEVVDKRKNLNEYKRIKTLEEYGIRIQKAAGMGTNVEFVTKYKKVGGNGPILGVALLEYGIELTYIGALGGNGIHPVFESIADKCTVYSIAEPAHTDALEFEDGKLMMGKLESLKSITWENIKSKVGSPEKIAQMINKVTLLGMTNWTMVPYMSEVWEGMIQEVLPLMPTRQDKPFVFFDLADPEKRTNEDILKALNLIREFEKKFRVILGLNKKELLEVAEVLEIHISDSTSTEWEEVLEQMTTKVGERLHIYCLVVHPTKEAVTYCNGQFNHTYGPYTANPKLTTGAGDNFNAGFCYGQSLGLSIQNSLLLGTATSGYYVRNAKSPTIKDMIEFLGQWKAASI